VWVPAAVALTVLLVVMFYPAHPVTRVVALSPVTWGPEPSVLNLMGERVPEAMPTGAKKKRLAIVILLSNFTHLPEQNRIDTLYRSLEPPIEVRDRYDLISPAVFDHTIGGDPAVGTDDRSIVAALRSRLDVSEVLLVDIKQSGKNIVIEARLRNAVTGGITRQSEVRSVPEGELIPKLEQVVLDVLHQGNARPREQ